MDRMELDRFVADYGFDNEYDDEESNLSFDEEVRRTIILTKRGEKDENNTVRIKSYPRRERILKK